MDLGSISGTVLPIVIMVLSVIIVGGLSITAIWLYMKWKRYSQFKCVIWERDGFGQLGQTYDEAGIFVDNKTQNKRFFLKKANVGLTPDNIPYVPAGRDKVVYLLRTGLKNFHFIKPAVANPVTTLSVGEEDVNWAVNDYEKQKKLFQQSALLQFMPFILMAFVSIVILTIFIYFFKEFGSLKEMAVALKEAAHQMALIKSGTVVVG